MNDLPLQPSTRRCAQCNSELAPALRSCPLCGRLVHTEELQRLAAAARQAESDGDLSGAMSAWRSALDLLPVDTRQAERITAEVDRLSQRVSAGDVPPAAAGKHSGRRSFGSIGAAAVAVALLAWKLKAVLLLLLTKAKFLLFGLSKMGTASSMLLSFGVYWSVWGWRFAAGLIASMYVHEMGHIAALRRYGIKSSAPAFIPGLGALVRLKQSPVNAGEDARVGLAGPLWGLGAVLAADAAYLASGWEGLGATARTAAFLNLFNLVPLFSLDGGRGFRALSRQQRWLCAAAIAVAWLVCGEGLLVLLFIAAVGRAFGNDAPQQSDQGVLIQFVGLVFILSALCVWPPLPSLGH